MDRPSLIPAVVAIGIIGASAAAQDWASFANETSTRLVADADLVATDGEEKDYDWGDVDNDGDPDLVIVRKQPFTTPGRKRNVLLINEGISDGHSINGVLVDQTTQFMSAADDGGQGFLDETNDRDVRLIDVDGDGWLDVVTSTAYGQDQPKTISHSRIYMNQGENAGLWQGFRYEEARIPELIEAPNTCAVGVGDVTGDGAPDLYYVSYNSSLLEDHLLVNDGDGTFVEDSGRLTSGMLASGFGTAGYIVDMNGDGWKDIVKSENGPLTIHYNNGSGNFVQSEQVSNEATYHVSVGDLNSDGKLDLISSNDGGDRYRINQGNGANGLADFLSSPFSFTGGGGDDGFGSNSVTADLNNDGFNDVLVADVDVDASGCGRRMHIYRNLGNLPNPTLQEQQTSSEVVGIPTDMLTGTHDVAVMDINLDGWNDLVIGRCSGTQVWMNQPPIGVQFTYPNGLPPFLEPGATAMVELRLITIGGANPTPGSVKLLYSVNGSLPFTSVTMTDLGDNRFEAEIPAATCTDIVDFYFTTDLDGGGTYVDPGGAPIQTYRAVAALGSEIAIRDEIEGDTSSWEAIDDGLPGDRGQWEAAEPDGTLFNGFVAAPFVDGTQAHEAVKAFVTENALPGFGASWGDVDGGPMRLLSPSFDLAGTDGDVSYSRWMFSMLGVADEFTVDITNDGGDSWTPIPEHTTSGTDSVWETVSFTVTDYITPSANMRLRFTVADAPNDSVTEAGVDNFQVRAVICDDTPPCPGDTNGDGQLNIDDIVNAVVCFGQHGVADCAGPGTTGDIDDGSGTGAPDGQNNIDDIVYAVLRFGETCE